MNKGTPADPPETSFEFIAEWFQKARDNAEKQGRRESAQLWDDGLTHLRYFADLAARFDLVRELSAPERQMLAINAAAGTPADPLSLQDVADQLDELRWAAPVSGVTKDDYLRLRDRIKGLHERVVAAIAKRAAP